ncbi:MAG: hypothetical protein SPI15_10905 [Candidatus Faecousia sp.]|nr:hypothetical protein [Clostridiales bacterium]MDY6181340.1 hypothetical protein [Candidatus Faecousia sp.]
MKLLRFAALVLCLAALGALAVCIFTDWNDELYLPLALCLGMAGNGINVLSASRKKGGREKER